MSIEKFKNYQDSVNQYADKERKKLEALPQAEKDKQIEGDHELAMRVNKNIEFYVSSEAIVSGINPNGLARTSEAFKNNPTDDMGMVGQEEDSIGASFDTQYIDYIALQLERIRKEANGEKFKRLKGFFENIPIIDLGAGQSRIGYNIARILGASGYIGVEPYSWSSLEAALTGAWGDEKKDANFFKGINKIPKVPFSVAPEDALTFLKRLPDHSVGIMTAGTDYYVLFGDALSAVQRKEEIEKYIEDVVREIARVMHPKSAFLETESSLINRKYLERSDEDSVPESSSGRGHYTIWKAKNK